jgi:hypothetical protein
MPLDFASTDRKSFSFLQFALEDFQREFEQSSPQSLPKKGSFKINSIQEDSSNLKAIKIMFYYFSKNRETDFFK